MTQKGLSKAIDHTPGKEQRNYAWKELREKESKLVKGKFVWRECPGGTLEFHYKAFSGDPVKTYHLTDGFEYELPIGVIKHLVNNCQVEETTNKVKLLDPYSREPMYEKKLIPRFAFITSEYFE